MDRDPKEPLETDFLEPADPQAEECCSVCLSFKKNCCIVPCGHLVCMRCGRALLSGPVAQRKCPICRNKIAQTVRIFQ